MKSDTFLRGLIYLLILPISVCGRHKVTSSLIHCRSGNIWAFLSKECQLFAKKNSFIGLIYKHISKSSYFAFSIKNENK